MNGVNVLKFPKGKPQSHGRKSVVRGLLKLMRSKFDVGLRKMDVGAALLRVEEIRRLPRLLKPVSRKELISFFTEAAKII